MTKKEIVEASEVSILNTTATTIRIRSFIQEACFSDGIPGSGEGDGRGPSATSGTHRTQIDVTTYFDPDTYLYSEDAGESVAYLNNGCNPADEIGRDTVTINEDITVLHYSSYATVNVEHSVGAPFSDWAFPNIDYRATLYVYQDGGVLLSGQHDGFPNYEVYKTSTLSSGWSRLYYWDASAEGQGFGSLYPPMEQFF